MDPLQKQIEVLTAGVQKVSTQIELSQTRAASGQQSLSSSISQSAVTLHRVAAFCFTRYRSLKITRVLVRFPKHCRCGSGAGYKT